MSHCPVTAKATRLGCTNGTWAEKIPGLSHAWACPRGGAGVQLLGRPVFSEPLAVPAGRDIPLHAPSHQAAGTAQTEALSEA